MGKYLCELLPYEDWTKSVHEIVDSVHQINLAPPMNAIYDEISTWYTELRFHLG